MERLLTGLALGPAAACLGAFFRSPAAGFGSFLLGFTVASLPAATG